MCGSAPFDDQVPVPSAINQDSWLQELRELEARPSVQEECSQEDLTCQQPMDTEEFLTEFESPIEFTKDGLPNTFIKQEPLLDLDLIEDDPEPTGYSDTRTYARVVLSDLKIPNVGKTFRVCWQCDDFFADSEAMTCHLQTHSEDSLVCIYCSERFLDLATLRTHVKTHLGDAIFWCDLCGKQFYEKELLDVHMRAHDSKNRREKVAYKDGDDPLRINASDIKLVPSSSVILPYKCEECGMRFGRKFDLTKHQVRHGERPFECDICHKRFFNNYTLKYHQKVHEARQPIECDYCDKTFSKRNHLTSHIRKSHSAKVKSFECKQCHKKFALKGYLNMHKRSHKKDKTFDCDKCDKRFSTLDDMNEHRKSHTRSRSMRCVVCKLQFADKTALKDHLEMHLEAQRKKGFV